MGYAVEVGKDTVKFATQKAVKIGVDQAMKGGLSRTADYAKHGEEDANLKQQLSKRQGEYEKLGGGRMQYVKAGAGYVYNMFQLPAGSENWASASRNAFNLYREYAGSKRTTQLGQL